MVLVLALVLLLGLVLTADRPGVPEQDRPAAAAATRPQALRHNAPVPRDSARAVRVRLRAHAPEREDDPSHAGSAPTATLPPRAAHPSGGGSPPCSAALLTTFCTLRC
jgi:hypothetical protein